MKLFIFLSEIIGKEVLDKEGNIVGRLCDLPIRISDEVYPKAAGLVISRGLFKKEYAHINVEDIKEIKDEFRLKKDASEIEFGKTKRKYDLTFCNDILDQQVVDTEDQKVVRVNDIHLLRVDNQLFLAHVDVGTRGIVRRLGWEPFIDYVVKSISSRSAYLTKEEFIPWKNTQVLTSDKYKNVLRLDVARKKLSLIPPTDLAEIMEDLDIFEKLSLFKSLEVDVQRRVFADLATQEKQDLIDQMTDKEAADILQNIPADEATDLLMSLPKEATLRIMRNMQSKTSKQLRKLLGFAKDSAGGLMTTEYLYLKQDAYVKDAMKLIKENLQYPGNIFHIYIIDEQHHFLGSTSLRLFLNLDPNTPIMETCHPKKIFVRTDDGMEEIALMLEKYKFSSIPVLSEDDILQGVITTDDVMEELISLAWSKYKDKLV